MDKKIIIMGGIAVVFGGLSIVAGDYWLKANTKTEIVEVPVSVEVEKKQGFATLVVAAERITYGDKIRRGSLTEIPWPDDRIPEGGYRTINEVVGDGERAALGSIEMNEALLASRITGPDNKATLSKTLEEGMRAVALKVDEYTAVSGFIVPGDHVDVAVSRRLNGGSGEMVAEAISGDSDIVTSLVLENVKVLTVGQSVDDTKFDPILANSVTLEVDQVQARKLSAAQLTGNITLHLRKAGEIQNPIAIDYNPTAAYQQTPSSKPTVTIAVRHGTQLQAVDVKQEAR